MTINWFIIASGPSLTKDDVNQIKGQNVIAINDNYKLAPWANIIYACDANWWVWHRDNQDLISFKGQKWTQTESWDNSQKELVEQNHKLNWIQSKESAGISTDPSLIHQGSNSGFQAINLAYHFGAQRIILLGYDMQATGGKKHWFGDHPTGVCPKFNSIIPYFNNLAEQLPSLDLEIINCTRETALTCFPKVELEKVLTQ